MYRPFRSACWLIGLLAASLPALADEPADDLLLGRLMNDQAIAVLRLDLAAVTPEHLAVPLPLTIGNFDTRSMVKNPPAELVAGARQLSQAGARYAYLVLLITFDMKSPFQVLCLLPTGSDKLTDLAEQTVRRFLPKEVTSDWQFEKSPAALVAGPAEILKSRQAGDEAVRPGLAEALAAAGDVPLAIAVVPSADQRHVLQELLPLALPGGEHLRPGLSGFRWLSIALGEKPQRYLRLISQQASDEQATESAGAFATWLAEMPQNLPAESGPAGPLALLKLFEPRAVGSRIVTEFQGERYAVVETLLKRVLAKANAAAARAVTMNRLKAIGLAFHTQESIKDADGRNHLPDAASRDAQGRPLLSWRVHALPFLEQAELHKQFHLDESWDSEHNKKLIPLMPEVYQVGSEPNIAAGKTCLVLPVGDVTLFPGGRGLELKEITDGTSNTIMVVEVDNDHAVTWTKPDDLSFDAANPKAGLGGHFGDGFLALLADGAAIFIPNTTDLDSLKAYFTATGRDVISRQ